MEIYADYDPEASFGILAQRQVGVSLEGEDRGRDELFDAGLEPEVDAHDVGLPGRERQHPRPATTDQDRGRRLHRLGRAVRLVVVGARRRDSTQRRAHGQQLVQPR